MRFHCCSAFGHSFGLSAVQTIVVCHGACFMRTKIKQPTKSDGDSLSDSSLSLDDSGSRSKTASINDVPTTRKIIPTSRIGLYLQC